jgi:threonine dehydrogenase-like Zn-dependent dehydrogenase
MPHSNFHVVPDELTDAEAAFCEPVAAACRIVEQGLVLRAGGNSGGDGCSSSGVGGGNKNNSSNNAGQEAPQKIAVLGDGKLGLLCAQVLALEAGPGRVTLFGRHEEKMALVDGVSERVVVPKDSADALAKLHADYGGAFDLVVEATGASGGVTTALALTRPMGTVVLKSTVSLADKTQPQWAALANDIVVAEKKIVGSRCGPMDTALSLMARHAPLRRLLNAMLSEQLPARSRGGEAVALASVKGTLKVQVVF